jgi:NDP-sugar pyrophosphorylase family protein
MKAFILCGGLGTRLRPYTYENPKPMLPIDGKPILQYVIEHLKDNGVDEMVLAIGYLYEKIVAYFGDGRDFKVKLKHAVEKEALGTAGAILASGVRPSEPFFVVMGDAITNIDLKAMASAHKKSGAIATVALLKHTTKIPYGVAKTKDGLITEFEEKPELEHYINTGIYVLSPEIFKYIHEKEDFAKDVFPRLLKRKEKIGAFKVDKGVWIDIGRLEEYEKLKDGKEIEKMLKN